MTPSRRFPVIDIHVHHAVGRETEDPAVVMRALLRRADRAGIDRLCLLGNVLRDGVRMDGAQIRSVNDTTIALVRGFPERVSGFCFLNPILDPGFLREEVDRCVAAGLRGIKLEIDLCARDARMATLMNKAAERGIPVLHHAWYQTIGKQPYASDPSDVADLARRFPDVRIVMAHLSGCGIRGVLDIADCPNVWIDTSGGQPVAGLVEYAVERLGAGRVVFGSDECGREFSCQLGRILGARLSARDREAILGRNAAGLLGLGEAVR
jgi:uncharacterized protein